MFRKLDVTTTFVERPVSPEGTIVVLTYSGLPLRHPAPPPSPQYGLTFVEYCGGVFGTLSVQVYRLLVQ